jgi:hypothetical protein
MRVLAETIRDVESRAIMLRLAVDYASWPIGAFGLPIVKHRRRSGQ